jgi:hypothetical protein
MVASYTTEGDSFRADKPRRWSEAPFMRRPRQVSIDLHPDVLPFSNMPALLPPFLLRSDHAMTLVGCALLWISLILLILSQSMTVSLYQRVGCDSEVVSSLVTVRWG